jgi:hypothetical protein
MATAKPGLNASLSIYPMYVTELFLKKSQAAAVNK